MRLRFLNEVPTVILIAVVFLIVLRDAVGWVWGVVGILGLALIAHLGHQTVPKSPQCADHRRRRRNFVTMEVAPKLNWIDTHCHAYANAPLQRTGGRSGNALLRPGWSASYCPILTQRVSSLS